MAQNQSGTDTGTSHVGPRKSEWNHVSQVRKLTEVLGSGFPGTFSLVLCHMRCFSEQIAPLPLTLSCV